MICLTLMKTPIMSRYESTCFFEKALGSLQEPFVGLCNEFKAKCLDGNREKT